MFSKGHNIDSSLEEEDPLNLKDHMDGQQIAPLTTPKVFRGTFKDGIMDSFGQLSQNRRVNYSGQWKLGRPHGHG